MYSWVLVVSSWTLTLTLTNPQSPSFRFVYSLRVLDLGWNPPGSWIAQWIGDTKSSMERASRTYIYIKSTLLELPIRLLLTAAISHAANITVNLFSCRTKCNIIFSVVYWGQKSGWTFLQLLFKQNIPMHPLYTYSMPLCELHGMVLKHLINLGSKKVILSRKIKEKWNIILGDMRK